MDNHFIVPLTSMFDSSRNTYAEGQRAAGTTIPFASIFKSVINEKYQTEDQVRQGAIGAANGDIDRLHDLTIASTKSDMALKLFVQLRNKGHDAYSEIMRMGV